MDVNLDDRKRILLRDLFRSETGHIGVVIPMGIFSHKLFPVKVVEFAPRTVHAFIGVGAKIVPLRLEKVGTKPGTTISVVV